MAVVISVFAELRGIPAFLEDLRKIPVTFGNSVVNRLSVVASEEESKLEFGVHELNRSWSASFI